MYFNQTWSTAELPKTLYVRGIAPSTSVRDVEFRLYYEARGGPCEDRVKLTVVEVELESLTLFSSFMLWLRRQRPPCVLRGEQSGIARGAGRRTTPSPADA